MAVYPACLAYVSSGARCVVNEGTRQWGEVGYAVCV